MRWKDLPLSGKLGIGFGIVLVMLTFLGTWAILGIGGIVRDAEEVIGGNRLRGDTTQRVVDHLHWANQVNALITDDSVQTLQVETDPHKCAFGRWYYGDERKQAEGLVPSLTPILAAIEEPHRKLHESAIAIGKSYRTADLALGNFLREKKTDHLAWAHKVKDAFVDFSIVRLQGVEFDHTKCSLGEFLFSEQARNLASQNPDFASACNAIIEPHRELHESAVEVDRLLRAGDRDAARNYYNRTIRIQAYEVLDFIDRMLAWHDGQVAGAAEAKRIYATDTQTALSEVQRLLEELKTEVASHIMTDDQMLAAADRTRIMVISVGLIAILAGIVLTLTMTRAIVRPLRRGIDAAGTIATGDLSNDIGIVQKDEVGQLSAAMQDMIDRLREIAGSVQESARNVTGGSQQMSSTAQQMSQGATEQAAAAEEVSSLAWRR